jgi:hypothetical protein
MKIVRNRCNGGFSLSDVAVDFLGLNNPYADIERTDLSLVNLVEADANKASGNYARLEVVEIPDTATDWELDDHDGIERIIYVVNGKIHHK